MLLFVDSAAVLQQMLKGQPQKEAILATGCEGGRGRLEGLTLRRFWL